jgi:hypothetical protein
LIILDGAEQIGHGRQDRVDTAVKGRAPVRSVINASARMRGSTAMSTDVSLRCSMRALVSGARRR